jgi:hypothetical protein
MSKTKASTHRRGGLKVGLIVIAGLLLLGCLGGIFFSLNWLGFFGNPQARLTLPPLDIKVPLEAVAARRESEETRLNSYGWVDKDTGVVTIPISQAMILIADSGLPVGEPTATPTPVPTPSPTGASETPATVEPTATLAPTVDLANVSFNNNVLPIFEQHCTECHGGDEPKEGLRLTGHAEAMAGSMNGSVIEPGDVENSYLIEQIVTGRMPQDRPRLSPAEIEIITAWVEAGAPDN